MINIIYNIKMTFKYTKKNIKTQNFTLKKNKNKKHKLQSITNLIKLDKLKDPKNLRVGYVSIEINNNRYIVKLKNNKKIYAIANKYEIACHLKLKENIQKYINIFKTGNSPFKTAKGAISYAIRKTNNEFNKCTTTNSKYNRKNENRTYTRKIYDNYNYYSKYWYHSISRYLDQFKKYLKNKFKIKLSR